MSRLIKRTLTVLILLFVLVSAKSTLSVPAVASDGGGMMTVFEASIVSPGTGGVYIDVKPFVSVDTQDSAKQAVKIAAQEARVNFNDFDVLYHIDADAEIVDGPSGGAALALLAYAEFSNRVLRSDLAVTGSIERDGSIGKISGLKHKLTAVGEAGFNLFIVPRGQIVQKGVDLRDLGESLGVQVVEASDLSELVAYAFTEEGKRVNASVLELPPLEVYEVNVSSSGEKFKRVVESEQEALSARLPELNGSSKELVEKALNESKELLSKGYYYSAANKLFLTTISLDSISVVNGEENLTKSEFKNLLDLLDAELRDFTPKNKSLSNFEMVYGAEARVAWAKNTLKNLREDSAFYEVEALITDYASARAWLRAANKMNEFAGSSAIVDNEFKLREYALEKVEKANASGDSSVFASIDFEVDWHLEGARTSFSEGAYASAVFDACFVNSFVEASTSLNDGLSSKGFEEFVSGPEELRDYSDSMWSELYFVHSLYSWQEGNRSNDFAQKVNAVKLQRLSHCLLNAKQEMWEVMQAEPVVESTINGVNATNTTAGPLVVKVKQASIAPDSNKWLFLSALLLLVSAVFFMILNVRHKIKRRKPKLTRDKRLDLLDDLLLENKVSESTYKRLRKKYSSKKKKR